MGEDRNWMYSGWDKEGNYTDKFMDKTTIFLIRIGIRGNIPHRLESPRRIRYNPAHRLEDSRVPRCAPQGVDNYIYRNICKIDK
jgi:hypothetical protein